MSQYLVTIEEAGPSGCGGCLAVLVIIGVLAFFVGSPDFSTGTSAVPSEESGRPGTSDRQPPGDYQQRYVNVAALAGLQENEPIVLVAAGGASSLESQLARGLRDSGMNVQAGILKPAVFESDVFQRLADGDGDALRRLGLSRLSGRLVLCRLSFGELVDTGRLVKTRAYLAVAVVPLRSGQAPRREFSARGAGFRALAAERQAQTRVLEDFLGSPIAGRLAQP